MTLPAQPRLRRLDHFPMTQPSGEVVFALRDPEGFATPVVLPYPAARLASLMDGSRTFDQLRDEFERQCGQSISSDDVTHLVHQLDERYLLDTDRFRTVWKREVEQYLNNPVRPAAHAGRAYAAEPTALAKQLDGLLTVAVRPDAPDTASAMSAGPPWCAIMSPHIDLHRGGPTFANAYQRLSEQTQADVFVIFGTAHIPLRSLFSVTRKHFDTPLGTIETDKQFVAQLAKHLAANPAGSDVNLAADELAHRYEHSIELQVIFLQRALGQRPFKIVPVLVGSFHEFIAKKQSPGRSPAVSAFISAMRKTAAEHTGRVFYINGADLAHIGQRFGDRALLNVARLREQADDDQMLLAAACRADAEAFFRHVAEAGDRNRICGLGPTYTMLEVARPERGELLKYDQAVELDGTSCVTFASLAFCGSAQ